MRALNPVPDIPPKAVLYLRQSVSRDDSISIELQEIAGRDYCTSHGYEVVAVEKDEGLSGRKWSTRPAVQRVLEMIESNQADIIILWKWSRLSRNRKDWAVAADRVDVAGGRIESATEPIDTATASGRFARGVMTEYAAFQSEQISEQWSEVHQRRFNLGLPPTGAIPWGWKSERDHIYVDPVKADAIRHMYKMYRQGSGLVSISHWLNDQGFKSTRGKSWQFAAVRACLESPIHAGLITYRGQTREGAHDGIITAAEFEQFQTARRDRSNPKRPRKSPFLLSTLVVCHCGAKRAGNTGQDGSGRKLRSYVCTQVEKHPRKSRVCSAVDAEVGEWVKRLPVTATHGVSASPKTDLEILTREITAVEKQLVKLTEHLLSGLVPESAYQQTRDKLTTQKQHLSDRLREAEQASTRTASAFIDGNEDLIAMWDSLSVEKRQGLLRTLIDTVTINEDNSLTIRPKWAV